MSSLWCRGDVEDVHARQLRKPKHTAHGTSTHTTRTAAAQRKHTHSTETHCALACWLGEGMGHRRAGWVQREGGRGWLGSATMVGGVEHLLAAVGEALVADHTGVVVGPAVIAGHCH